MAKGPSPRWRARKEPILDGHLQASIDQAGGVFDPATGWYKAVHLKGMANRAEAKEVQQALFRSARHLGVSVHCKIMPDAPTGFLIEFVAINKDHARAFVPQHYGANLPYNPHRRNSE